LTITNEDIHRLVDNVLSAGVSAERVKAWLEFEAHAVKDSGLQWTPEPGALLVCDFGPGLAHPEMRKQRPVVVISPRRKGEQLCIVAPISTSLPKKIRAFHVELPDEALDPRQLEEGVKTRWVKCNCVTHVSIKRLAGWHVGGGERVYHVLPDQLLAEIRLGVLHAIGVGDALA
jgi:uncharacterized protein YifN (PemK superfamily)